MIGVAPDLKHSQWRWTVLLCLGAALVVVLMPAGVDPRLVGSWELTTAANRRATETVNLFADGTGERLFLNEAGQAIRREPICWEADRQALTFLHPSRSFRIDLGLRRLYASMMSEATFPQVRFYYQDFTPNKLTLRGGVSPASIPPRAPTFTMTRRPH
jgi:hypothetical protein